MRQPLLALLLSLIALPGAAGAEDNRARAERVVEEWKAEARQAVTAVDTATLKRMVDSDRAFTLLDVRTRHEREAQGSIDPFREVDLARGYIEFKAPDKLAGKPRPIIVYCGSGLRSLLAADTLLQMGYADVHNYSGGLKAWQEAGHSVAP
jgi:rhodanese-related sulfurtransferase